MIIMKFMKWICNFQFPGQSARVNCSVNELAELNAHSCTTPLRVVADFFLRNDPFIERCTAELDPKKKIWSL